MSLNSSAIVDGVRPRVEPGIYRIIILICDLIPTPASDYPHFSLSAVFPVRLSDGPPAAMVFMRRKMMSLYYLQDESKNSWCLDVF